MRLDSVTTALFISWLYFLHVSTFCRAAWPFTKSHEESSASRRANLNECFAVAMRQGGRRYQEDRWDWRAITDAGGSTSSRVLFGVYDGHSNDAVSSYLQHTLLQRLEEQLLQAPQLQTKGSDSAVCSWMDHTFGLENIALTESLKLNASISGDGLPMDMIPGGSTALVGYLTDSHLALANVGDCRAAFLHLHPYSPTGIPLTVDQRGEEACEVYGVRSRGGRVVDTHGILRVNRILMPTRAFGDLHLQPIVEPKPDCFHFQLPRTSQHCNSASRLSLAEFFFSTAEAQQKCSWMHHLKEHALAVQPAATLTSTFQTPPPLTSLERERMANSSPFLDSSVWHTLHESECSQFCFETRKLDHTTIRMKDTSHSHSIRMEAANYLLVGSDGLWDAMTEQEAAKFLRHLQARHTGMSLQRLAAALADHAERLDHADNVTAMLIDLQCIATQISS